MAIENMNSYGTNSKGMKRAGQPRSMNDAMDMLDDISGGSAAEMRERFVALFSGLGRRVSTGFRGISARQFAYIGAAAAVLVGTGIYWNRRGGRVSLKSMGLAKRKPAMKSVVRKAKSMTSSGRSTH